MMKDRMKCSIIIIHRGWQSYVKLMLYQLMQYNNASDIYFVDYERVRLPGLKTYDISGYMEDADSFAEHYFHLSPNPPAYELFSLQRWFIARELVRKEKIEGPFLCLDSDVLMYRNAGELWELYKGCDVTVCDRTGPGTMFFKDAKILDSFCGFIRQMYSEERKTLEDLYNTKKKEGSNEGISDMMLMVLWLQRRNIRCVDISRNVMDHSCCDNNIWGRCIYQFDEELGRKVVKRREDGWYFFTKEEGEPVKANVLHFQGDRGKQIMHEYVLMEKDGLYSKRIRRTIIRMKLENLIIFRLAKLKYAVIRRISRKA